MVVRELGKMMYRSNWDWLGIEPTDNAVEIKKAFAAQSKKYHPEEFPEEFKSLRKAYQSVMKSLKPQKTIIIMEDVLSHNNEEKSTNLGFNDSYNDNSSNSGLTEMEKLDFNPLYDSIRLKRKHVNLQSVLNRMNLLYINYKERNNIDKWREILENESTRELYNSEDFSDILNNILIKDNLKTEIYAYVYELSVPIEGDENFKYLQDDIKEKSHIIINQCERKKYEQEQLYNNDTDQPEEEENQEIIEHNAYKRRKVREKRQKVKKDSKKKKAAIFVIIVIIFLYVLFALFTNHMLLSDSTVGYNSEYSGYEHITPS